MWFNTISVLTLWQDNRDSLGEKGFPRGGGRELIIISWSDTLLNF